MEGRSDDDGSEEAGTCGRRTVLFGFVPAGSLDELLLLLRLQFLWVGEFF